MRAGIDLGGTKIQAVVIDDDGRVVGQERLPTPTSGGPADVAEAMAASVRTAAAQAGTVLTFAAVLWALLALGIVAGSVVGLQQRIAEYR